MHSATAMRRSRSAVHVLICLLLIVVGAVGSSLVQTGGGHISVQGLMIPGKDGAVASADLFRPDTATAERKAPLIIVTPGFQRTPDSPGHDVLGDIGSMMCFRRVHTNSCASAISRTVIALATVMACWIPAPAAFGQPTPSASAPTTAADCTAHNGVWAVVDMPDEPLTAGCAQRPSDGMDALHQIGVDVRQPPSQPGLVCELQGRPEDACSHGGYDKSTRQFWSYWHATSPSDRWTFSSKGAAQYHPVAGSVEGWRWGTGKGFPPRQITTARKPPAMPPERGHGSGPLTTIGVIVAVIALGAGGWWARRRQPRQDTE